jgi:Tfp pilus assembly protein PilP
MANRTIYINTENEGKLKRVTDPELNLSGLLNNLLAEWFEKVGLK